MSVPNQAKRRGEILDEIMRHQREQLPRTMQDVPLADLRALVMLAPPPRDFFAALKMPGVSLIAECKKASPSKGLMVRDYDAARLARTYEKAGARAISVLTDSRHFQGSLADLRDVREAVKIPVLRKDFIFDPYQVYEARAAGADALLLIASVLGSSDMAALLALTDKLGMSALVEVHTAEEVERVLPLGPRIIGVNNRNLQTFQVDFANTARLRSLIPPEIAVVGESGVKTATDVQVMADSGVDAILVGETLVKSADPLQTAKMLVAAGRRRVE